MFVNGSKNVKIFCLLGIMLFGVLYTLTFTNWDEVKTSLLYHRNESKVNFIAYNKKAINYVEKKQEVKTTQEVKSTQAIKTTQEMKTTQAMKTMNNLKTKDLRQPFNAEEWSNATVKNIRKHYVILYWSRIFGQVAPMVSKDEYNAFKTKCWPNTYAGEKGTCPVSCEITNNRTRVNEAAAFVVHSRDVGKFPPSKPGIPWLLQGNENPVYTPALRNPKIMNKFNLSMTYRLDSDFPSPIHPMPTTSKPMPFKERIGDVLAVFSNCERVRTEYMRQLMKFIEVHSYGSCLKNKNNLIHIYGKKNGKYDFKQQKIILSRSYKFSLVFMNQDCDYFIDDRLYHALETGSVPVFMGTDKVDQFLPGNLKNSIIKVSDFNSPAKLAGYLKYLSKNETAYNEYLKWKELGIGDMSGTDVIERWWNQKYPLFCQVCMKVAQGNWHQGLNTDNCKARQYKDWNLLPPYGRK